MSAKWVTVLLVVAGLTVVLWASDRITYEGERTVYTVRCDPGQWEGLQCRGTMVAGERHRFKASISRQEVLYWVVGSTSPYGKFAQCKVKDRGNWSCVDSPGQPPTITHEMMNGRPRRDPGTDEMPFHAVPKWVWWLLDAGIHVYNKAGY